MPPQPLEKVKKNAVVLFEWDSLSVQPSLAALVMQVITTWSYTDVFIGQILARFMKADHHVVVAMFEALSSTEAKRAVIDAAAEEALAKEDYDLLVAAMRTTSSSRRRRNDFAHHVWGRSKDIPNAALLAHPKILTGALLPSTINQSNLGSIDTSNVFVYRERDLLEDVESANTAARTINSLFLALGPPTPKRETIRNDLLNQPAVQQQIRKLSQ